MYKKNNYKHKYSKINKFKQSPIKHNKSNSPFPIHLIKFQYKHHYLKSILNNQSTKNKLK